MVKNGSSELSDREIGRFEERLEEARHRLRNHNMSIDLLEQEVARVRSESISETQELRMELKQLKTRMYSTMYVVGAVAAVAGWVLKLGISLAAQ